MQIQSPLFIFPLVYNNNFAMRSTLNERNTQYVTQNKIDYMLSRQWLYDKKIFMKVCPRWVKKKHISTYIIVPHSVLRSILIDNRIHFMNLTKYLGTYSKKKIKSIYITMPNTHLQGQKFVFLMYILQHKASDQSNKTKNKIHILSIAKSKHKKKCCKVFMKIKKTYMRLISVQ